MTITIADYIKRANELDQYVEDYEKAAKEHLAPYKAGIEAIKQEILSQLQAQGVQNFKTDYGTAYQSTILSAKVDNPIDFRQFVLDGHWEFADLRCLKEPVKDWLDQNNGVEPPGIKTEFFTKCNIRRS